MAEIICNFCGKRSNDVLFLIEGKIEGKSAHICNECVHACIDVLEDELTLSYEATEFFDKSINLSYFDTKNLKEEFEKNNVASHGKFFKKTIAIADEVKSIGKRDEKNKGFSVTLRGRSGLDCHCYFEMNHEKSIQKIIRGERVIVVGTYIDYRVISDPAIYLIFEHCMLIGIKGENGSVDDDDDNIICKIPVDEENFTKRNIVLLKNVENRRGSATA